MRDLLSPEEIDSLLRTNENMQTAPAESSCEGLEGAPATGPPPQNMQPFYNDMSSMPQRPQFVPLTRLHALDHQKSIELFSNVPMELSVVLGHTERRVRQILSLKAGTIIELDKYAEEQLDIYVNGMHIGQGEVVVIEEKLGIRVSSINNMKEPDKTES